MTHFMPLGGVLAFFILAASAVAQPQYNSASAPVVMAPPYAVTSPPFAGGQYIPPGSPPNATRSAVAERFRPQTSDIPDTYIDLEYLLWGLGDVNLPRILTSNQVGTPLGNIAQTTTSSTQTLIGGESVGDSPQSGMRLRAGRMYCDGMLSRLEFTGFFFFDGGNSWHAGSINGNPILARPFTSTNGQSDAQIISFPGISEGTVDANYKRRLYAFEPLAFLCLQGDGCRALEFLTGYRFMRYEDQFEVIERVRPQAGGLVAPGTELVVEDSIRATNDYHVFPLGLSYVSKVNAWRFDARALMALGFVHQEIAVRGSTIASVQNDDVRYLSGFFAQPPDIGTHDRTQFAWIPEVNLTVRRCLRGGVWMNVGYSVMYLPDVVRAPEHIHQTIDPALLPPAITAPGSTAFAFHSSDAWIHGLNAGLQWNY